MVAAVVDSTAAVADTGNRARQSRQGPLFGAGFLVPGYPRHFERPEEEKWLENLANRQPVP